jgi:hypothetical protein
MRSFIGPVQAGPPAQDAVPGTSAVQANPAGPDRTNPAGQTPPANRLDNAELVGLTISGRPVISSDHIPIAQGSAIRFAVTNGSGRDGVFEILFYKVDPDPARHITISQSRLEIKNGEMAETPVFTLAENGRYRLIVKTNDNRKLIERTWRTVEM